MTLTYSETLEQFYEATRTLGALRGCQTFIARPDVVVGQKQRALQIHAGIGARFLSDVTVWHEELAPEGLAGLLAITPVPTLDVVTELVYAHAKVCAESVLRGLTQSLDEGNYDDRLDPVIDAPPPAGDPARTAWLVAGAWSDGLRVFEKARTHDDVFDKSPYVTNVIMRLRARLAISEVHLALEIPDGLEPPDL